MIRKMGMIADIIVAILFIVLFISMSKKGLIKAIYSLCGHILTFILVGVLLTPATEFLMQTPLGETVSENVTAFVMPQITESVKESGEEKVGIAPVITKTIIEDGVEAVAENVAPVISDTVMKILTAIILFVLIRFIIFIVFMFLDTVFKMPVLSRVNRLAGGLAGILNALLIIYVFCGILSLNFDWANEMRGIVDETVLLKHFYLNNVLLDVLIH